MESTSSTTRREQVQEKIETRKETIAQSIDTRNENLELKITSLREKLASREAEFRLKLEAFKDKAKAQIADRININLNRINQNQTDGMLRHLELMSRLLDRLSTRVNQGSPEIKDPAAAKEAIASASAAIATATGAVKEQAGHDYSIDDSTENTVKAAAQAQRKKLHDDLQKVRKLVIEAKHAVRNAIRAAVALGPKEGTGSAKQ